MDWGEAHNAAGTKRLEVDPRYQILYDAALTIAGAKDRIPAPCFLNGAIHHFWQDADHLRGIWRKASLADYPRSSRASQGSDRSCETAARRERV